MTSRIVSTAFGPIVFAPIVFALSLLAAPVQAQTAPKPAVTLGIGLQTSFARTDTDATTASDNFLLNSVPLTAEGSTSETIKFTFGTDFDSTSNHVTVLDALARFEFSDRMNIWIGRMLPPSDRANLYGPYFSHHWSSFTDGVQDGYPFVAGGRDNGAAYWGQFGKVKVQAGAFDGAAATGRSTLIGAGRLTVDFWDPEPGYYLDGTKYGAKNILAIGIAGQTQGSDLHTAHNVDLLLERKVGMGGAFTIEGEFARYDGLGGYNSRYTKDQGGYILGSYLVPTKVGEGRFELLAKFAKANFSGGQTPLDPDYDQKTTEANVNYIIKDFDARVMLFFKDTRFNGVLSNNKQIGLGIQLQR